MVKFVLGSVVVGFVVRFHLTHLDLDDAASFSFKIWRARNILDRTAASLIPKVAATSRGVISSTVERTSGSRNFQGNAVIIFSSRAFACRLCNCSSAAASFEASS